MTVYEILELHIPSLSDDDEAEINRLASDGDAADLALRTCRCSRKVDGFYDYVDHLKEEMRKAGL